MSASNPVAPEPTEIAGRYQIVQKLGAGAFGTVYKAKDKEDWVHIFDLSRIKRRADLPDSKRLIRDRLRRALCGKVRLNIGLSNEEFEAMNQTQVTSIIKDHDLNDLLYNDAREYQSEELRSISDKIRRWEK